jgi:hypothetical protein
MSVIHESKAACPRTQTLWVSLDLNLRAYRGMESDELCTTFDKKNRKGEKEEVTEMNIKCT